MGDDKTLSRCEKTLRVSWGRVRCVDEARDNKDKEERRQG